MNRQGFPSNRIGWTLQSTSRGNSIGSSPPSDITHLFFLTARADPQGFDDRVNPAAKQR
jgi:hypothetical protein